MGIFSDYAPKYFESGFNVVPATGKAVFETNWTQFCKEPLSEELFEKWCITKENYNVGLCLGPASNVMVFDVDTDDPEVTELLKKVLPPTPVVKRGAKGFSYFYKYSGEKTSEIKLLGKQIIDVLSIGRQTIVPPSIHPVTNLPYQWVGDSILDYEAAELPTLGQDLIDEIEKMISGLGSSFKTKKWGKDEASGRNNTLKHFALSRLRQGDSVDKVVDLALFNDKQLFGSRSLFEDPKEIKGETPRVRAYEFVNNMKKYILKKDDEKLKESGIDLDVLEGAFLETQSNGFYFIKDDGKEYPDFVGLSEHFKNNLHYKSFEFASYIYGDNHYKLIGRLGVSNLILRETNKKPKPHVIRSFKEHIDVSCFVDHDSITKNPTGFLNLDNGVLDTEKMTLASHSPSLFFTYKTPIKFDLEAKCPTWFRFLKEVFCEDAELAVLAQQMFGYCLMGGRPFLHKAFWLSGDGRNGKGTFQDVLRELLGRQNVSCVQLKDLDKPFSVVNLDGKLANITDELPTGLLSSAQFKTAVAGEPLIAAHKGKPEFELYPMARFIFAGNNAPKFGDDSSGLTERIVAIPFNRFFKIEERDVNLSLKLRAELSGILNWAVEGLRQLRDVGFIVEPRASLEEKFEYEKESNSVLAFCEENIDYPSANGSFCSTAQIYVWYKIYCDETGRPAVGLPKFAKSFSKWAKKRGSQSAPEWGRICSAGQNAQRAKGWNYIVRRA